MRIKRKIGSIALALMMVMSLIPSMAFADVLDTVKTMELPEKVFSTSWNATYDKIYYEEGTKLTYDGKDVTLLNDSQLEYDGETKAIKSQKVTVDVSKSDDNYQVSIRPINYPVGQVSGKWNSTYGGVVKAIYVEAGDFGENGVLTGSWNWQNKKLTLDLGQVAAGTHEIKGGTVFEKANQYSPGVDFGDGKGVVTERLFGVLPDITLEVGGSTSGDADAYLGVNAGSDVPTSWENDIWYQYDFKELTLGETARLVPRRVPEAVTDVINNNVEICPFHAEIIRGDSVKISEWKSGGKMVYADVTAVKAGDTVVKLTYDAFDHSGGTHFDAIDPVNTTYVVYSVDGNRSITITDNIDSFLELKAKDATVPAGKHSITSYDTLYFTEGETTPLDYRVSATGAATIKVRVNGITVEPNGDGGYTLPLENRDNILEVVATAADGTKRSLYRTIAARKIKINLENVTNPDKEFAVGDEAKVSFTGIKIPVYKLATIYNPTFHSSWAEASSVRFQLGDQVYKGYCSQWDLAKKNSFTVTLEKKGENTFKDGKIECQWWGSNLGTDKEQDQPGLPNLNAPITGGFFSSFPEFTITAKAPVAVETVEIDKDSLAIKTGETQQLSAEVKPDDATIKTVVWTSSNGDVATVDNTGLVTAKTKGEAIIKATCGGKEDTCTVSVTDPVLESIAIDKDDFELYEKNGEKLQVTYTPASVPAEEKKVRWTSSNEKIVTVDREGNLVGLMPGEAIIKVESVTNPEIKDQVKVTVKKIILDSILFDEEEIELIVGQSKKNSYVVTPAQFQTMKLNWTSSDESIAKVKDGNVVALGEGSVTITASHEQTTGSYTVSVKKSDKTMFEHTVMPEKIYDGDEVTIGFVGLEKPADVTEPIWEDSFSFNSDIAGLEKIKMDHLGDVVFTVPEGTPSGTYYLTNGKYYAHYGGRRVQGMFLVGDSEKTFYNDGEFGVIELVVLNREEIAQAKKDLETYKDKKDYRSKEKAELETIIEEGKEAIDAAKNEEEIKEVLKAAKKKMDKLKTAAQYAAEENPIPTETDFGKVVGNVNVNVSNHTFLGGAFTGTILNGEYSLHEKDTMMTVILKALKDKGFSWNSESGVTGDDYTIEYLAYIYKDVNKNGKHDEGEPKLGEFDGAGGSGWKGTLNDWFTNFGFQKFSYENGELGNGDLINLMYTNDLGADIGGTWGDADTRLKALDVRGGTLTPTFNKDGYSYDLIIPSGVSKVKIIPTAMNKNYLVKTFLNVYDSKANLYKRTELISVKAGDIIYIGCGDKSWPSMNKQGPNPVEYTGTKYILTVKVAGVTTINDMIAGLPDPKNINLDNYQNHKKTAETIKEQYDSLSPGEQASVQNLKKLNKVLERVNFFQKIDEVKELLKKLPNGEKAGDSQIILAKNDVEKVAKAYEVLSEEQKKYVTTDDVKNYNTLVKKLKALGTDVAAKTIKGSDGMPEKKPLEEKNIKGVKNTQLDAKSGKLKDGKIKVTWDKSKGYRVDYYEVYRSVKRYSGFGKKAFFATKNTKNPKKRWYINSKSLKKGTRYYYKVRGVRMVDGKKIYTKWSNKAFRIA